MPNFIASAVARLFRKVFNDDPVVPDQLNEGIFLKHPRRIGSGTIAVNGEPQKSIIRQDFVSYEHFRDVPVEGRGEDTLNPDFDVVPLSGNDQESVRGSELCLASANDQLPMSRFAELCPGVICLVTGSTSAETEALEAALGVLVAQPEGPHFARSALLAFRILFALTRPVSVALALALLVALVFYRPRGVAVARSAVGEVVVARGTFVTEDAFVALQAATGPSVHVALVRHGTRTVALTRLTKEK